MPLAPPPDPPMQEIVVTGRGLAVPAGDAAYDIVTIDHERLATVASGRIEDVLRDVAGFAQYRRSDSRSAHPTSQGATLRGLGGNASSRALVLLDGVPQTDPFGGWIGFAGLDPARLGQVRVTRGGGSGVNGPGALAGTIELESRDADDQPSLAGSLAYGSREAIDAGAALAGDAGRGRYTLAAEYQRGDGFVPIVKAQRGPADVASPYTQATLTARGVVPLGEAEIQATMRLTSDARARGLAGTRDTSRGADASLRAVGRGRWGFEALGYVQLRRFRSGFASANAGRTAAMVTLDQYNVPGTGIGGRIELRPPIAPGIEARIGADMRRTSGETDERFGFVAGSPTRLRSAGGRTTNAGLFAELGWQPSAALTLTAGGRIDGWWIANGRLNESMIGTGAALTRLRYPDRHGSEPTARGGIAYRLGGGFSLRGAAYLGWRLPTLNELYRPFRAGLDATAANPALDPERLKGVDAGIDWRPLPSIGLSATIFHNRLDDAIGNITLGQGPGNYPGAGLVAAGGVFRQRGNLDAIRSRGLELDGHVTDGRWTLTVSYAHTDARVRAGGAAAMLDGLRPAQTPSDQASATIMRADAAGRSVSATLRYVSHQYEDDQNSRSLAPATTLDLTFRTPLVGRLALELRGENVTDTRIEATIAADGTIERASPRTIWIGLRYGG